MTSSRYALVFGVALISVFTATAPVVAQSSTAEPATENGRYVLSPIPDGVLRLDTRTGSVSTCTAASGNWACRTVPDERAAYDLEIGKLNAENKVLKDQLALREAPIKGKIDAPLAKEDSLKKSPSTTGSIELKLPDQEKVAAFADRVWQRLRGMAVALQRKLSEKLG